MRGQASMGIPRWNDFRSHTRACGHIAPPPQFWHDQAEIPSRRAPRAPLYSMPPSAGAMRGASTHFTYTRSMYCTPNIVVRHLGRAALLYVQARDHRRQPDLTKVCPVPNTFLCTRQSLLIRNNVCNLIALSLVAVMYETRSVGRSH